MAASRECIDLTPVENRTANSKPVTLLAAGLLTPAPTSCGGPPAHDAIVVGTTDKLTISTDAPAPLDPAYAYDIGAWNILRQTVANRADGCSAACVREVRAYACWLRTGRGQRRMDDRLS